jgi:hypothetical protein
VIVAEDAPQCRAWTASKRCNCSKARP